MNRRPGFLQIVKREVHDLLHDRELDARKLFSFDLRVGTIRSAEEAVHQRVRELGLENEKRRSAQGLEAHDAHAARNRERVDELAELQQVSRDDGNRRDFTKSIGKRHPVKTDKALVDDVESRHPTADDAVLVG